MASSVGDGLARDPGHCSASPDRGRRAACRPRSRSRTGRGAPARPPRAIHEHFAAVGVGQVRDRGARDGERTLGGDHDRMVIAELLGEPWAVRGDEGEVLGDPVMEVAGHRAGAPRARLPWRAGHGSRAPARPPGAEDQRRTRSRLRPGPRQSEPGTRDPAHRARNSRRPSGSSRTRAARRDAVRLDAAGGAQIRPQPSRPAGRLRRRRSPSASGLARRARQRRHRAAAPDRDPPSPAVPPRPR